MTTTTTTAARATATRTRGDAGAGEEPHLNVAGAATAPAAAVAAGEASWPCPSPRCQIHRSDTVRPNTLQAFERGKRHAQHDSDVEREFASNEGFDNANTTRKATPADRPQRTGKKSPKARETAAPFRPLTTRRGHQPRPRTGGLWRMPRKGACISGGPTGTSHPGELTGSTSCRVVAARAARHTLQVILTVAGASDGAPGS